jgi:hypothetical protein
MTSSGKVVANSLLTGSSGLSTVKKDQIPERGARVARRDE